MKETADADFAAGAQYSETHFTRGSHSTRRAPRLRGAKVGATRVQPTHFPISKGKDLCGERTGASISRERFQTCP